MNNTNFTESIGVINPKTKRYQAYDIIKGRIVPYKDPYMYSKAAKRLCTQYINIFGYEPEMVVPPDLKYYPDSGRFIKYKPKKEKTRLA